MKTEHLPDMLKCPYRVQNMLDKIKAGNKVKLRILFVLLKPLVHNGGPRGRGEVRSAFVQFYSKKFKALIVLELF